LRITTVGIIANPGALYPEFVEETSDVMPSDGLK